MEITSTVGCHTTDRMVSVYVRSPAGFQVEHGHGGRLVDDQHLGPPGGGVTGECRAGWCQIDTMSGWP